MKNILYIFILFIVVNISRAQEIKISYHDKMERTVTDPVKSYFYRNSFLDTVINNINIYRIEEFYTATNTPKKIAFSSSVDPLYPKYFFEKRTYFENGNIESLIKYNISGNEIDTAYHCYPTGTLKMITYRNPKRDNIVSDKSIEYIAFYDENQNLILKNGNGKIKFVHKTEPLYYEEGGMENSYRHNKWSGEYGGFRFEENYQHGSLISGKSFLENGKIVEYDSKTFHVEPAYTHGMDNLLNYIAKNYEYPAEAIKQRIRGTVEIEFTVNKEGYINDIKIVKDLGLGTGEAAEKLVRTFGKWKPGSIRGIPQDVKYKLPIRLSLN